MILKYNINELDNIFHNNATGFFFSFSGRSMHNRSRSDGVGSRRYFFERVGKNILGILIIFLLLLFASS